MGPQVWWMYLMWLEKKYSVEIYSSTEFITKRCVERGGGGVVC